MANPRTIARLEARILERAAHCLQFEVNDPRASFITITGVKLSSDITSGKIYYSVLGDPSDKTKVQHMLDHAAGFIQRQVARILEVRRMPHLSWVYDDSVEHAADLARLIHEARERDKAINPSLRAEQPVQPTDPRLAEELAARAAMMGLDEHAGPETGEEVDGEADGDDDDAGESEPIRPSA